MYMDSTMTLQAFVIYLADNFCIPVERIELHSAIRKDKSDLLAAGLVYSPVEKGGKSNLCKSLHDIVHLFKGSSEIFVEDIEARGVFSRALADSQISFLNHFIDVKVENELGDLESDGECFMKNIDICIEKDTTILELKRRALEMFDLDPESYCIKCRLITASDCLLLDESLPIGSNMKRLRLTHWFGEAGEIVTEIKGTAIPSNSTAIEECQIPTKNELFLKLYLWLDHSEEASYTKEVESNSELDAFDKEILKRKAFLKKLPIISTSPDNTLYQLKCELIEYFQINEICCGVKEASELQPQDFRIRELREDYLPGQVIRNTNPTWYKSRSNAIPSFASKSLNQLHISGRKKYVITMRNDEIDDGDALFLWAMEKGHKTWPPHELIVNAGACPNVGHVKNKLALQFKIKKESLLVARYVWQRHTWALVENIKNENDKKKKKARGPFLAGSCLNPPHSIREGDLLAFLEVEKYPNVLISDFESEFERIAREKLDKSGIEKKAEKKTKQKTAIIAEVALQFRADFDFSDEENTG